MIIKNAIARNTELKGELVRDGRLEKAEGVQLGIEALKHLVAWRAALPLADPQLLPGETEE